jgi:hypothetical protein
MHGEPFIRLTIGVEPFELGKGSILFLTKPPLKNHHKGGIRVIWEETRISSRPEGKGTPLKTDTFLNQKEVERRDYPNLDPPQRGDKR